MHAICSGLKSDLNWAVDEQSRRLVGGENLAEAPRQIKQLARCKILLAQLEEVNLLALEADGLFEESLRSCSFISRKHSPICDRVPQHRSESTFRTAWHTSFSGESGGIMVWYRTDRVERPSM